MAGRNTQHYNQHQHHHHQHHHHQQQQQQQSHNNSTRQSHAQQGQGQGQSQVPDINGILEAYRLRSPMPEETKEVEKINMLNIRRLDDQVKSIVHISSQAAVYTYGVDAMSGAGGWGKSNVAGSLLLYERFGEPRHGIVIMNRIEIDNYNHLLSRTVEFESAAPYLLFKDGEDIRCVWLYTEEDCNILAQILQRLGYQVDIKSDFVPEKTPVPAWGRQTNAQNSTAFSTPQQSAAQSQGAQLFQLLTQSAERSQVNLSGVNGILSTPQSSAASASLGSHIVYTAPQAFKQPHNHRSNSNTTTAVNNKKSGRKLFEPNGSPIVYPTPIKLLSTQAPQANQNSHQPAPAPSASSSQISSQLGSSFVRVQTPVQVQYTQIQLPSLNNVQAQSSSGGGGRGQTASEIEGLARIRSIFDQIILSPDVADKKTKAVAAAAAALAEAPQEQAAFTNFVQSSVLQNQPMQSPVAAGHPSQILGMQTVDQLERKDAKAVPSVGRNAAAFSDFIVSSNAASASGTRVQKCISRPSELQLMEMALKEKLGLPQVNFGTSVSSITDSASNSTSTRRSVHTSGSSMSLSLENNGTTSTSGSLSPGPTANQLQSFDLAAVFDNSFSKSTSLAQNSKSGFEQKCEEPLPLPNIPCIDRRARPIAKVSTNSANPAAGPAPISLLESRELFYKVYRPCYPNLVASTLETVEKNGAEVSREQVVALVLQSLENDQEFQGRIYDEFLRSFAANQRSPPTHSSRNSGTATITGNQCQQQ